MDARPVADEPAESVRLRARWVFPVDAPPLENGTVEIAHGRIAAVHSLPGPVTADLGNVAIIPGLVNAHTHLELSDVASPLTPATPFTSWLRAVIAHRRGRSVDTTATERAVRAGIDESLRSGVTCVGDIVSSGFSAEGAEPDNLLRGVAFLELIGLSRERVQQQLEGARSHLLSGRNSPPPLAGGGSGWGGPRVAGLAESPSPAAPLASRERGESYAVDERANSDGSPLRVQIPGLSPHAPYSVHPELFAGIVERAREFRAPVAMHLAETRGELELLAHGTGEFVEFLQALGVWQPTAIPPGTRPLDYLQSLATLECALVIHGNYLSNEELNFLADCDGMSVVYCPRTHAYFGHDPHPWRELLARGVNVALGTDSRASNPDLSLWNELTFLRRLHPDVSPATLLELATIRGARALGQANEIGTLTPGQSADLTIVSVPASDVTDPYALLFHPESRVKSAMCRGRWPATDRKMRR